MKAQQNQYPSWIKAYDAVVALGLAREPEDIVEFPINSTDREEYTRAVHSFGEIMRRAFGELNSARLSNSELRELKQAVRTNEGGVVQGTVLATIDKLNRVTT